MMRRALAAFVLAVVLPLPSLADVTVKPGETLSEIAERHGVSVTQLMQANGIQDPTRVQAGQRLVIPGGGGRSAAGGARATGGTVVVQPGDTLSEIAARNGISLQQLMQRNGIRDPELVEAGRRLVVDGGPPRSGGGSGGGTYTVRSGETLSDIAERYNTSVTHLMRLNGISDPALLQAGGTIVVPGVAGSRSGVRASGSASAAGAGSREHLVQPGESLSEIASTYNMPVEKLVAINGISDPDLVISGTRLKLTAPPPPLRPARQAPAPLQTATAAAAASRARAASSSPAPTAPIAAASRQATPTPATAAPATATTRAPASRAPAPARAAAPVSKPYAPDWRTYGPLQVDWGNWQPMGGSYVAPSLNGDGQTLYTAINCGARKLNATGQTGQWRTWEPPRTEAEQQLVSDLCKAKGG